MGPALFLFQLKKALIIYSYYCITTSTHVRKFPQLTHTELSRWQETTFTCVPIIMHTTHQIRSPLKADRSRTRVTTCSWSLPSSLRVHPRWSVGWFRNLTTILAMVHECMEGGADDDRCVGARGDFRGSREVCRFTCDAESCLMCGAQGVRADSWD